MSAEEQSTLILLILTIQSPTCKPEDSAGEPVTGRYIMIHTQQITFREEGKIMIEHTQNIDTKLVKHIVYNCENLVKNFQAK